MRQRIRMVLLLAMLFGASLGVLASEPEVLVVGASRGFERIQDAMDAAEVGDTIHIEAGEYIENPALEKAIQLFGLGSVVLVPADAGSPAITVTQDGPASIQNLSIRDATIGISVTGQCLIANCDVSASEIGLEAIVWDPHFVAALFCSFSGSGVGVQLVGEGDAYVLECEFEGLGAAILVGGGMTASIGRCTIESCFEGVVIGGNTTTVLLENVVRDNFATAVRLDRGPLEESEGELYMLDNAIENNGKWAISFCDMNGVEVDSDEPFMPVYGEGNVIRDNGFGIACPSGVELPDGFLSDSGE